MIRFKTTIEKFQKKGEKSGWSYIPINEKQAAKLTSTRTSFRVKGMIDEHRITQTAVLPMGDGSFILPVNGKIRKAILKEAGAKVDVQLDLDEKPMVISPELMTCLKDDKEALDYFTSLPKSHQQYFSNWIDSAKTITTRSKRITMAVISLAGKQGFGEMIRANKKEKERF